MDNRHKELAEVALRKLRALRGLRKMSDLEIALVAEVEESIHRMCAVQVSQQLNYELSKSVL